MTTSVDAMAATLQSALWSNGGGTIDPRTGNLVDLDKGYLVSLARFGKEFLYWPAREEIAAWLTSVAPAWRRPFSKLFLGTWHDKNSKPLSVWCDLNQLVMDESTALQIARHEGQRAIWNNATRQSVTVRPVRRAA